MRHEHANVQHPERTGLLIFPAFLPYLPDGNDAGCNDLETRLHKRENLLHSVGQKLGRNNHALRHMKELLKIGKTPARLIRACLHL